MSKLLMLLSFGTLVSGCAHAYGPKRTIPNLARCQPVAETKHAVCLAADGETFYFIEFKDPKIGDLVCHPSIDYERLIKWGLDDRRKGD